MPRPETYRKNIKPRTPEVILGELFYITGIEGDFITGLESYANSVAEGVTTIEDLHLQLGRRENPEVFIGRIKNFTRYLKELKKDKTLIRHLSDDDQITIEEGVEEVILPLLHEMEKGIAYHEKLADIKSLPPLEQHTAFMREGARLLIELCDHPEINIPLQETVRHKILNDTSIESPQP